MSAVPPAAARYRGLPASDLAVAAAMAAVCIGLVVIGSALPQAGGLQLFIVVPFGVVAHRHGARAVIACLIAAASISVLVMGLGNAVILALGALLGGVVGELKRRRYGVGWVFGWSVLLGPALAALLVGLLLLFASYRRLVLKSFQSSVRGFAKLLANLTGQPTARHIDHAAGTLVRHWAPTVAGLVVIAVPLLLLLSWELIGEVLDRLRWVGEAGLTIVAERAETGAPGEQPVAPLPLELRGASVSFGQTPALEALDLTIPAGQFIAIVGDNGSGKSTLARLLAGGRATQGAVVRAGAVGLGRPGGTAMITQRPESQVIGLRVADDVVWGMPDDHRTDVSALLDAVGLAGLEERDTATLSGGELQRLAVASALAREPRLLISDEATAMVDPDGRRALVALFAELPRRYGMTVVHVTHHEEEAAAADRVLRLEQGRLVRDGPPGPTAFTHAESAGAAPAGAAPDQAAPSAPPRSVHLTLTGIGHDYGHGTVWEHRALRDVTLSVAGGEGVLIVGENGSGKSTLAWIVAGLLRPTYGTCLLDGQPLRRRRGAVGLAFQHARLQLQRPTVGADIVDAAGWMNPPRGEDEPSEGECERRVAAALRTVRLDPALAGRSIEQLSGGQQRRVAIAGLLARDPRVLVLDEPLAGLDSPAKRVLIELLAELRRARGLTLIVVTHDAEPLQAVCPRTIRLDAGRVVSDTLAHDGSLALGEPVS